MIAMEDVVAVLNVGLAGGTIKDVEGIGAIPAAFDQVKASPTAFVLPPIMAALPNDAGTGLVRQKVDVRVQVLLVFTGIGADAGADLSPDITAAIAGIIDTLTGKVLADMNDPLVLVSAGGAEVDQDAGTLLYPFTFGTGYTLRKN